jgi:hypothetical protein
MINSRARAYDAYSLDDLLCQTMSDDVPGPARHPGRERQPG